MENKGPKEGSLVGEEAIPSEVVDTFGPPRYVPKNLVDVPTREESRAYLASKNSYYQTPYPRIQILWGATEDLSNDPLSTPIIEEYLNDNSKHHLTSW